MLSCDWQRGTVLAYDQARIQAHIPAAAAAKNSGDVLPKGKVNQYTPEEVIRQIAQPQAVRASLNVLHRLFL
jgi:hypothetical protein